MRYFDINTISFNDTNGRTVPIKDVRPIPTEVINFVIVVREGDLLDEIASRDLIFGPGFEDQSFRIFDANAAEIFDANFDLSQVRSLKIPV